MAVGAATYEDLLASWNAQGGPFKDALNNSPKYVASTTLEEPLPWPNSMLLRGDIVDALRALKAQSGGVLAIMGSGVPRLPAVYSHRPHAMPVSLEASGQRQGDSPDGRRPTGTNPEPAVMAGPPAPFPERS
jgi:hypothetical protein